MVKVDSTQLYVVLIITERYYIEEGFALYFKLLLVIVKNMG